MTEVAVGVITNNGRVLACQRKRTVRYPLKWEFPGGKLEPGETPRQALIRELREELMIDAEPDGELLTNEWIYRESAATPEKDAAYRVTYFIVPSYRGELVNQTFESIRWVTPAELERMDILAGIGDAISLLLRRQRSDGSPL
jgi:8-oxo-dGTP diphosphatase